MTADELKRRVKDLGKPEKPTEIHIAGTPGLLMRIQPTGRAVWYYNFKIGKRRTRVKLGLYPAMGLKEAKDAAAAKRTEQKEGRDPGAASRAARTTMTLRALMDDHYLPWARVHLRSHATVAAAVRVGFAHLLDQRVSAMGARDWTQCQTLWAEDGTAPKTQNNRMRVLQSAIKWSLENGVIDVDPVRGQWRSVRVDSSPKFSEITKEEEALVLDLLADDLPWRALFITALDSGCRRGELLALTWDHVDLEAGRLTVSGVTAKSKQTRVIPLTRRCAGVLGELRRLHGDPNEGRVWFDKGNAVSKRWDELKKAVGITRRLRFHDLRATFCTRLCRAGVAVPTVQRLAGHSKLEMTMIYLRHTAGDAEAAIALLE